MRNRGWGTYRLSGSIDRGRPRAGTWLRLAALLALAINLGLLPAYAQSDSDPGSTATDPQLPFLPDLTDPNPALTCDAACAVHLLLYGRNPIVTVQVPGDAPGVNYLAQIQASPEGADASVLRNPALSEDLLNRQLQISCTVIAATDPCEAWVQVPTGVRVEFSFGAADTWAVPVSVAYGGAPVFQSLWDGEILAERAAAAGGDSRAAMSLGYGIVFQVGTRISDVPTITAKWRGGYEIGCRSAQTGTDPAKTDHFYNVVDFPTPISGRLPFDQNSIKNCQYPPDDPLAHAEG